MLNESLIRSPLKMMTFGINVLAANNAQIDLCMACSAPDSHAIDVASPFVWCNTAFSDDGAATYCWPSTALASFLSWVDFFLPIPSFFASDSVDSPRLSSPPFSLIWQLAWKCSGIICLGWCSESLKSAHLF